MSATGGASDDGGDHSGSNAFGSGDKVKHARHSLCTRLHARDPLKCICTLLARHNFFLMDSFKLRMTLVFTQQIYMKWTPDENYGLENFMLRRVSAAIQKENNPALANYQPPAAGGQSINALIVTMVRAYNDCTGKQVNLSVDKELLRALPNRTQKAITDKARGYFGDNFGFSQYFTFAQLHEVYFLVALSIFLSLSCLSCFSLLSLGSVYMLTVSIFCRKIAISKAIALMSAKTQAQEVVSA